MGELGGDLDLAEEAIAAKGNGQLRAQDLERDAALELAVLGEVDHGHPPTPELALDLVAIGEGGLELSEQIGHANSGVRDNFILGRTRSRARWSSDAFHGEVDRGFQVRGGGPTERAS